jgi:hypothetical protein
VEIYQGFENDSLVVYAYYAGDSVYYKARQSLTRAGDGYFGTLGDASHVYQLKDGHVVDVTSSSLGSVQFTGEVTFTRYQAAFPPSSWPRQSVDLP